MINNSNMKVADFTRKYHSLQFGEQQEMLDQHLTKITLLQDQLNREEQQLMQLVKRVGLGILVV